MTEHAKVCDDVALRQALALAESVPAIADRLSETLAEDAELQRRAALGLAVASIVHELSNLLTPILTYAQLAQEQPGNAQLAARCVQASERGGAQMKRVLDALGAFAGPDHAADPQPSDNGERRVNLQQALDTAISCLPGLPLAVDAELAHTDVAVSPVVMQQVFYNLLHNAAAAGARRVAIHAETPSPGGALQLRFADDGPGVPEALQADLFEPYTTSQGTGLGLYICKQLLTDAGGSLTLDSHAKGAVFMLTLPTGSSEAE